MSLRKNFKKLPEATKAEFTERLTLGVEKRYWTVIKGAELDKLRRLEGGGHFLPTVPCKVQGRGFYRRACVRL